MVQQQRQGQQRRRWRQGQGLGRGQRTRKRQRQQHQQQRQVSTGPAQVLIGIIDHTVVGGMASRSRSPRRVAALELPPLTFEPSASSGELPFFLAGCLRQEGYTSRGLSPQLPWTTGPPQLSGPELKLVGGRAHFRQPGSRQLWRERGQHEEVREIAWVDYSDRACSTGPWLTSLCDGCSEPLAEPLLEKQHLVVLEAALEKHCALLCHSCRAFFLEDRRRWLEPLHSAFARAYLSTRSLL